MIDPTVEAQVSFLINSFLFIVCVLVCVSRGYSIVWDISKRNIDNQTVMACLESLLFLFIAVLCWKDVVSTYTCAILNVCG